jgi:hypothetical protein
MYNTLTTFIIHFVLILVCGYIIRQYRYGVFLYEIYLDEAKKQGHHETLQIIEICSTPNYWHLIFKAPFFLNQFKPDRKWLHPFQWLKFSLSHVRWLFLYQYKMKNKSCQRLVHFNKLLFCWKYTITNDQTP